MDKIEKVLKAVEALKVAFPPPRNRSDYAEQIALFDLYEAADAVTKNER